MPFLTCYIFCSGRHSHGGQWPLVTVFWVMNILALQRCHALTIRNGASTHKIDHVTHRFRKHCDTASKIIRNMLNMLILLNGAAASGRVCIILGVLINQSSAWLIRQPPDSSGQDVFQICIRGIDKNNKQTKTMTKENNQTTTHSHKLPLFSWSPDLPETKWLGLEVCLICLKRNGHTVIDQSGLGQLRPPS